MRVCARAPGLISVRDPATRRVGDMTVDGVFPLGEDAVRPLKATSSGHTRPLLSLLPVRSAPATGVASPSRAPLASAQSRSRAGRHQTSERTTQSSGCSVLRSSAIDSVRQLAHRPVRWPTTDLLHTPTAVLIAVIVEHTLHGGRTPLADPFIRFRHRVRLGSAIAERPAHATILALCLRAQVLRGRQATI